MIPDNLYCVVKKNTEVSQLVTAMIGPTNWPLPPEAVLIDGFPHCRYDNYSLSVDLYVNLRFIETN